MVSQKEFQRRKDVHAQLLRTYTRTDGLVVEPLPELPPLDAAHRRQLLESVRERGILSPLIVSGKYVIDGRECHAIAVELGLARVPVKHLGTLDGPGRRKEYAIRINAERRHLTAEQRRSLLEAYLVVAPLKSSRKVADAMKVDRSTVDRTRRRLVEGGAIAPPAGVEGRDGKTYKKLPERKPSAPKRGEQEGVVREPEPVQAEPNNSIKPIKGKVCSYPEVCHLIDETPQDGKVRSVARIRALADVIGLTYEEAIEQSSKRRLNLPSPPKLDEAEPDKAKIYITPPKGDPRLFSGAWWRVKSTGFLVYIHNGDCHMIRTDEGCVRDESVSYVACYVTEMKELDEAGRRFEPIRDGKLGGFSHEEFYSLHTFDPRTTHIAKISEAERHLDKIDMSKLRGLRACLTDRSP